MFKYGEVLYRKWVWPLRLRKTPFRYRMDPVPGVGTLRGWFGSYYKTGTNCLPEKRVYCEHQDYVRGKRAPKNLPNDWNDRQRSDQRTRKSWKNKKIRKQYMKNLSPRRRIWHSHQV